MGSQELIDEIKQITSQYHAEVGSENKPWPKSIRDRVARLVEEGVPATKISKLTGIPYFTVLKWSKTKSASRNRFGPAFKELIVANKVDAVTVPTKVATAATPKELATALGYEPPDTIVPITTPDGYRIELPNVDAAIDFIMKLKKLGG